MELYSERNRQRPDQLSDDLDPFVRNQIIFTLEDILGTESCDRFWAELEQLLMKQYGWLNESRRETPDLPSAVVHFSTCNLEKALDFIEACFRLRISCGGQKTVDEINVIFDRNDLVFQLTPHPNDDRLAGEVACGQSRLAEDQLPRVILRNHELMHKAVVEPALNVLRALQFAQANTSMLQAFTFHRAGDYGDAITTCGSAFETFLKVIRHEKGWKYDEKDTCGPLVQACYGDDLFHSRYIEDFKLVGRIRNDLGTCHGPGPNQDRSPTAAHSEHQLHLTCTHMLFLAKLADLE